PRCVAGNGSCRRIGSTQAPQASPASGYSVTTHCADDRSRTRETPLTPTGTTSTVEHQGRPDGSWRVLHAPGSGTRPWPTDQPGGSQPPPSLRKCALGRKNSG